MKSIDLCGEWKLISQNGEKFNATVPGCVHTDLFNLDDIFLNDNSKNYQYVENENWTYEKTFFAEDLSDNAFLVFDGLDTYCNIYLNGKKIGFADNMFIPHSFRADDFLRPGENTIRVEFLSPIEYVKDKPALPGAFTTERLHTRRIQFSYGWDWAERLVTCGIYKPCCIEFRNKMKTDSVYIVTKNIDEYSASMKISEYFSGFEKGGNVKTEIFDCNGKTVYRSDFYCSESLLVLNFDIVNPMLWYPIGYGNQPLYTLKITVGDEVFTQKFGIRSVKILRLHDKEGNAAHEKCKQLQSVKKQSFDLNTDYSGFTLIINGIKAFCMGANWVPCETFPSAEANEKITSILEAAAAAGINMIRVWGGGMFECEHFYNECDRLGIMVTQDFLMACGKYPEYDESFLKQITAEAEFAAVYLRNHPSLVWWTGDNENAVNGCDSMKDYDGRTVGHKAILPVLERLDYSREFLYSSPFGGNRYCSKTVGTTHNTFFLGDIFAYIDKEDLSDYRNEQKNYTARFIAEEPILGAIMPQSLNKFIETQDDYDMWLWHTKTNPALGRELLDIMTSFAEKLFGKFGDWDDKYFKMRYIQYEWVRLSLQNARMNWDFCSGIIYWMLNDCWPAASGWSVIDYYSLPKPGYYAIKNNSVSVTGNLVFNNGFHLFLSNIRPTVKNCRAVVKKINYKTNETDTVFYDNLSVNAGITDIPINTGLNDNELLLSRTECDGECNYSYYKIGTPVITKCNAFRSEIFENEIEIHAETFLFAVEITGADSISDNYLMLESGETVRLKYSGNPESIAVCAYTLV